MLLTALALTFIVFFLTNLSPNLEKLARSEGSVRMTDAAVQSWIEENGPGGSVVGRYAQWLGVAPGWVRTDEKGVTRGLCYDVGVTADTAIRLGRYFATSPEFWLNMQTTYDLVKAQSEHDYSKVPKAGKAA